MDASLQPTSSHAFLSMKIIVFRLKFQWNIFPRVQLATNQHWFIWTNAGLIYLTHICVTRPYPPSPEDMAEITKCNLHTDYVHVPFLWKWSQNTFDDESTLVQVMAWYRQAKIHYLNQCLNNFLNHYWAVLSLCCPYVCYTNWVNWQIHKCTVPYPTMHNSEQKFAHSCSELCIVGYGTGALWDLLDRSTL